MCPNKTKMDARLTNKITRSDYTDCVLIVLPLSLSLSSLCSLNLFIMTIIISLFFNRSSMSSFRSRVPAARRERASLAPCQSTDSTGRERERGWRKGGGVGGRGQRQGRRNEDRNVYMYVCVCTHWKERVCVCVCV